MAAFAALCEGRDEPTPSHPVIRTDYAGEHHLFRMPSEPIGHGKSNLPFGIETRGYQRGNDGGYIIAAGSRMPDGRSWSLIEGTPSLLDGTLALPPRWLIDQCRPVRVKPASPTVVQLIRPSAKNEEAYALSTLNRVASELAAMPPDTGRDNKLVSAAGTMGRMIKAGWIGYATVEGRLVDACRANKLLDEIGENEVRDKIKRSVEAVSAHEPLPDKSQAKGNGKDDSAEQKTETARQEQAEGGKANELFALIKSSKQFVSGFIPPDYIVDGLLQEGFLYSLTGATGSGKTAIDLRLAASIALGVRFTNRETKMKRVLYFAAENPDDVRMRWIALSQHMDFDVDSVEVFFVEGVFKISQMTAALRQEAEQVGGEFGLIIVDTSPAFYEGDDENNRTQMGAHARLMRSLIDTIPGKPTVVANCHPVKNAAADNLLPAGGGSFLNEVDGNLTAAKTENTTELHWQGKFRGVEFAPMHFMLRTVTHERLKDKKQRLIPTVICEWISDTAKEEITQQKTQDEDRALAILKADPKISFASLALKMGWKLYSGEPHKSKAVRCIENLKRAKLIKETRGGYHKLTAEGEKVLTPEQPK